MTSQKKPLAIVIGLGRHFAREHRVQIEIRALSKDYDVLGVGLSGADGLSGFKVVKRPRPFIRKALLVVGVLSPRLRLTLEVLVHFGLVKLLRELKPQALVVHNIVDAAVARRAGKVYIFDSHEYLPRQFDGSGWFMMLESRYRRAVLPGIFQSAGLVLTEGERVLTAYQEEFSLPRDRLMVMASMPEFLPKSLPRRPPHRTGDQIELIHHGLIVPERGLEFLVEVVSHLSARFRLTFMGPADVEYAERLLSLSPPGRVAVRDPVPPDRIVSSLVGFDIGLVFFGSRHYHHRFMTVPNKFWQCLQARVPVLVGPDSAMSEYVAEKGVGLVAPIHTAKAFATTLESCTPDLIRRTKDRLEELAFSHSSDAWMNELGMRIRQASDRSAAL